MPSSLRPTQWVMSFAIALFLATNLSWPNGYSIGSALALLTAIYVLVTQRPALNKELRPLVFFCGLMALCGLWTVAYHHDNAQALDLPSRYLAAILLLWAGQRIAPSINAWLIGAVLGGLSAAAVSYHDLYVLGLYQATGYTGGIQFGNIGLTLGIFCAAGLTWASTALRGTKARLTQLCLLAGTLGGLYTSLASGTRGGWIAVPVVVLLFAFAYIPKRHTVKAFGALILASVVAATALWQVPIVHERINEAVQDIAKFNKGNDYTSVGLRFSIWIASTELISMRPLTGWGDAGYHSKLHQWGDQGLYSEKATHLANTHNNYLEAWVQYGLLGIVALLGLLITAFTLFSRHLRHPNPKIRALALSGTCLVSMYSIFCLTHVMLGRNNTLLFFLVCLCSLYNLMLNLGLRQTTTKQATL